MSTVSDLRLRRKVKKALEDYASHIRTKAIEFSRHSDEIEDFVAVGREAVWRAVAKAEPPDRRQRIKPHAHYRAAIKNAMLNYSQRVAHKPNGSVFNDEDNPQLLPYRRQPGWSTLTDGFEQASA